jgi:hypothetical protein
MPTYVPAMTGKKTDASADLTPPKKAAPADGNVAGGGMGAANLSHSTATFATIRTANPQILLLTHKPSCAALPKKRLLGSIWEAAPTFTRFETCSRNSPRRWEYVEYLRVTR